MSTIYMDPVIDWNPSMIATSMWYDPADYKTLTIISSNVAGILDKSGNGRNLPVDTAFPQYRPAYVANSLNGLAGINFNPDKRLYNNTLSSTTVNFVIAVIKSSGGATWGNYHAVLDRGVSGTRIGGILEPGSTGFYSGPYPTSAWQNGTSVTVSTSCFTNISSPFLLAYRPSTTTMTSVALGNYDAGSGGGAATQYETIALPTLPSQADREKLEGYLAHKWGIAASLPALHPYKTFKPTA